mmetsp:Transcript_14019/g.35321  ORF Transcript_14019/g.35321 Transcript_14019/m.35321 type:complete len:213 (-) Transcript_14019:377-1015(-)
MWDLDDEGFNPTQTQRVYAAPGSPRRDDCQQRHQAHAVAHGQSAEGDDDQENIPKIFRTDTTFDSPQGADAALMEYQQSVGKQMKQVRAVKGSKLVKWRCATALKVADKKQVVLDGPGVCPEYVNRYKREKPGSTTWRVSSSSWAHMNCVGHTTATAAQIASLVTTRNALGASKKQGQALPMQQLIGSNNHLAVSTHKIYRARKQPTQQDTR